MPPPTTMKRVADELGVSITTVSKVLNNSSDIGDATRARVLAKVAELGYQPNAVARSLTLRRTRTLGIIIPDLMHSFFVEIVAGIESIARNRGLRPPALQLERGSAQGARGSRNPSAAPGGRRRPGVGQRLGEHRPPPAPGRPGHRAGHDRSRRSPRRQMRSRRDRRRGGRSHGHEPSPRTGAQGDRAHRGAGDRPRPAANGGLSGGAAGARHSRACRMDRARRVHGCATATAR